MRQVDREIDRYLALLRDRIHQKGFTQNDIQDVFGWGRGYISQLLTKQKKLRVEQLLLMLNVIDVDPADFFAEFYDLRGAPQAHWSPRDAGKPENLRTQIRQLETQLQALVKLLLERRIITSSDLRAAEQEAMASDGRQ